eukprot:1639252-Rhodomonas_salina.1
MQGDTLCAHFAGSFARLAGPGVRVQVGLLASALSCVGAHYWQGTLPQTARRTLHLPPPPPATTATTATTALELRIEGRGVQR